MNKLVPKPIPLIAVILLVTSTSPISAASFNCVKANSTQEKLICDNPALGQLDQQLAQSYKSRLAQTADPKSEKRAQLHWLTTVRNTCTSSECLFAAYSARLDQLKTPLTAQPNCPLSETALLGHWLKRSGASSLDEIAFSTEHQFDSWFDRRPEFSGGSWQLSNCTIVIQHSSEAALKLKLKVVDFKNGQLHLFDEDDAVKLVYTKLSE